MSCKDCGKPYLLELHDMRVQKVAVVHDLPCDVLHMTQWDPFWSRSSNIPRDLYEGVRRAGYYPILGTQCYLQ